MTAVGTDWAFYVPHFSNVVPHCALCLNIPSTPTLCSLSRGKNLCCKTNCASCCVDSCALVLCCGFAESRVKYSITNTLVALFCSFPSFLFSIFPPRGSTDKLSPCSPLPQLGRMLSQFLLTLQQIDRTLISTLLRHAGMFNFCECL